MKHFVAPLLAALVAGSLIASTPDQLFTAGKEAMGRGDAEKAVGLFEQAVKLKPNSAEYHYWLGNAYGTQAERASIFSKAGLATKTKDEFERAVQLDPNYLDARSGLIEYYLEAPGFMGGSEEKALLQAQEIRKRDVFAGHRAFARIYAHQKKPELVRKEYLDVVREQPNSPKAHLYLALYLMSEKNWKQALEELDATLKLDAAYMPAYFRVGQLAVLGESNYARGEESLKRYLAYTPKEDEPPAARGWYWLGRIYEKQGRIADAKLSYAASLKLNPSQKDVAEAMKRVS